jgi:hypothetical protein
MAQLNLLAICPYCSIVSQYHIARENAPRTRHLITCPKCDQIFTIEFTGKIGIASMQIKKPQPPRKQKPNRMK